VIFLNLDLKLYRLFVYATLKIVRNSLCQKERNLENIGTLLEMFETPFRKWKKNLDALALKPKEPKDKKIHMTNPPDDKKNRRRSSLLKQKEKKEENIRINGFFFF